MDLVQVDIIHVERAQAIFHGGPDAGGRVVPARLGGQKTALPIAALQSPADGRLARAVSLGRIDQADAVVQRRVDRGDRRLLAHEAHAAPQWPRSKPQDRYLRSILAQLAVLHDFISFPWIRRTLHRAILSYCRPAISHRAYACCSSPRLNCSVPLVIIALLAIVVISYVQTIHGLFALLPLRWRGPSRGGIPRTGALRA